MRPSDFGFGRGFPSGWFRDSLAGTLRIPIRFQAPVLTRWRILLALGAAILGDGIQLGFLGMIGIDEVIDVILMVVISLLLGFHPLFLPTFVIEFIPILGAVPTWTGCVIAVIALRRRAERNRPPTVISPTDSIDI